MSYCHTGGRGDLLAGVISKGREQDEGGQGSADCRVQGVGGHQWTLPALDLCWNPWPSHAASSKGSKGLEGRS